MALSFGGIASGLPPNIVEMIMKAERRPLALIENNKKNQEAKLELMKELRGYVTGLNGVAGALRSFAALRELKARSSNESILSVTVDKERAKPGVYTLKVEQLAKKASAISNPFPDKDETEVGIGYIVFDVEGEEQEVFIGEDNNTLEGIANSINTAGLPVRASVVLNETTEDEEAVENYHLIIATENEGANQEFNFPNFYFLDGDHDFYFENEAESQNGRIVLDGFPITIRGNKLTQIIPGATVNLLDADPNKNVSIIIEEDIEAVADKVGSFVEETNKMLGFFEKQFAVDAESDTSKMLSGDSGLQTLQYHIRRTLQDGLPQAVGDEQKVQRLSDVGITFNRGGMLEYDRKKFLAAANENFKGVSDVFSANDSVENEDGDMVKREGIAVKLTDKFRHILYGDGFIAMKEKGLKERIRNFDKQIDSAERRFQDREKQLKQKFANLEASMSKLKAQQSSMAAAIGGGGGGPSAMFAGKMTGSP